MPTSPPSLSSHRPFLVWALVCSFWFLGLALVPAAPVAAQNEAAKPDEAPPAVAPVPAPKADEGAGVPPVAQKKSYLEWAIRASGPIGAFLVLLSLFFFAHVIRLFLEFRVSEAVPPALVERLELAIKDRKFQEAYDVCRDDNSFIARLVRTGVANLPGGRAEAKEAMNTVSEEIVIGMEQKISYLAVIGTLGPMIGLVGTIMGMIASFQEIATAAGSQPRADKVAEGISTALFITLEGVSLAVPAIFFFAFFRNRIAQIAMEANKIADRTINAFWNAARQGQSAKAPQPGASV